jgi:hypothetical protein
MSSASHHLVCLVDFIYPQQDLQFSRTFDPERHPEWLVFEVEGQLQIRPNQQWIAQHLLTEQGSIDQLNMGEGKTRVIMPMLALEWTRKGKHVVSRLIVGRWCLQSAYPTDLQDQKHLLTP